MNVNSRNASLSATVAASDRTGAATISAQPTTESDSIRIIDIDMIRQDGGTQGRYATSESTISAYADMMSAGVVFPPVRVWFDGSSYWLTDGFQRIAAAKSIGLGQICAEIHFGTLEDAQWDSYAQNANHGLRRRKEDVKLAVRMALSHGRAAHLSNSEIARHLGIPEATLRRWKDRMSPPDEQDRIAIVSRNGRRYAMRVSRIGNLSAAHAASRSSAKNTSDLNEELGLMKRRASGDTRSLLNIIGNWALGTTTPDDCLAALNLFLQRVRDISHRSH